MIKLEIKNYSMILIEKLQKYQPYHHVKFKYEYLTGEELLPSNQKQIIEQAKYAYSPLGKASEKLIKTIEDQRIKQVDALSTLKPKELEVFKDNKSDDNDDGKLLRLKEVFDELSHERMIEIQDMNKEIDFNNLTCYFTSLNLNPIKFIKFKGSMHIYNDTKNGETPMEKTEEDKKKIKSDLNHITTGNPKFKKEYQLNSIKNIKNLYNSRQKVNNLFNDYAKIMF